MKTRITAALIMIAAAVVMFLNATKPEPVMIAPKTKAPVPCPECPTTGIQTTWAFDQHGRRAMILKAEQSFPLLAQPGRHPGKPVPKPKPGLSPAASPAAVDAGDVVVAMQ